MDSATLLRENLELVTSLKIAYLSTVDEKGRPQTRAVFNLRLRPSRMKGWHRGESFGLDLPAAS
jgi:hypothetical protein